MKIESRPSENVHDGKEVKFYASIEDYLRQNGDEEANPSLDYYSSFIGRSVFDSNQEKVVPKVCFRGFLSNDYVFLFEKK